jgi:hypothetical protein
MRSLFSQNLFNLSALPIAALVLSVSAVSESQARCIPFEPGSATSEGGQVLILPDGSGPSLESSGATIFVQLWACPGEPVPAVGVPAQDMWLEAIGPGALALCAPGALADGPTDENGVATFSQALAGGGWTTDGVTVHYDNVVSPVPNVRIVSPDIDGNLEVDITDFSAFGRSFGRTDAPHLDFVHDGVIDLADFSVFMQAYGTRCP